MSEISQIVAIRSRRREKARSKRRAELRACDAAREHVADAQDAVRAYSKEVQTLEIDLLEKIVNKPITPLDVADIRFQLEAAMAHTERLVGALDTARTRLLDQENKVKAARAAEHQTQRAFNKINEMHSVLAQSEKTRASAAEEAAMDDINDALSGWFQRGDA